MTEMNSQQNSEDFLSENHFSDANVAAYKDFPLNNFQCNSNERNYRNQTNSGNSVVEKGVVNMANKTHINNSEPINQGSSNEDVVHTNTPPNRGRAEARLKFLQRACKENNAPNLKLSCIMKSKRKTSLSFNLSTLTCSEVKNLCTNRELTNFHSTNLETIFEEPQEAASIKGKEDNTSAAMGGLKIRRSLSFSNGLNMNKMKRRQAKVTKVLGRLKTVKVTGCLDSSAVGHNDKVTNDSDPSLEQMNTEMQRCKI